MVKKVDFHNIDHKKPLANKDDLRTAYYRAHRYMTDPPATSTFARVPDSDYVYRRTPRPDEHYQSEFNTRYDWKATDPNVIRNPRIELQKIRGMKDLDGRRYTAAPKPLNEYKTTNFTDYKPKVPTDIAKANYKIPEHYKIKRSNVIIDPEKPGYQKYLDMMATTNNLNYVRHSNRILAQNDIITVWNWIGTYNKGICDTMKTERPISVGALKEELCSRGPADLCPRRRNEFPSLLKHVPNGGLTSETRDNYKKPILKGNIEIDLVKPLITVPHKSLVPPIGINSIYGSGEPVDKFLSIKDYNKNNK